MRIVMRLILVTGFLVTQGCCWVGYLIKGKASTASTTVETKKETAPTKAEMSQQAKDLSKVAEATETANGIVVNLKGDVLFQRGKTELSPEASKKIQDIAAVLKKYPENKIVVTGHTDNVGSEAANKALSEKRAAAVMAELVKGGVPADKITAMGKGDTVPVAPNDTAENRAKNRRAEIKIEPVK